VGFTYGVFLIFSVLGIGILLIQEPKTGILFLAIMLFHTIIHLLFIPFTIDRYRLPVVYIVIIVGVYAISYLLNIIRPRFTNLFE